MALDTRTLRQAFRGLGDPSVPDLMAGFQAANRQARASYQSGDRPGAEGFYFQAVQISQQLGGGYGSDDLAFTRSILDGSREAASDWNAGNKLLASAAGRQGTGVDVNPDRGTFGGDVADQGRSLFDGLAKLSTPVKVGLGLAVALVVASKLKNLFR